MAKKQKVDVEALHRQAQVAALAGLVRGDDVDDVVARAAPTDVRGSFTPDESILELAVLALDRACPAGSEPLEYAGIRERYLPEVELRGRVEHRNSQYALYATAAIRGGVVPDLASDTGWWGSRLWIYAVYALVIYLRAAAERTGVPVEQLASEIAADLGLTADVDAAAASDPPRPWALAVVGAESADHTSPGPE